MNRTVAIAHTAALSAFGAGGRGLGHALATGAPLSGLPADAPLDNPRARKMMSRASYLAARCLGELVREVGWTDGRDQVGYMLGVGASGGSLDDVTALLDASIVDHQFSLERFGDRGLAACNPLLAFQLMNNFTMCHGAILEGLGGPNGALFSRGAGTVTAIGEAVHAVRSGECSRAIGGGADAPTHPVTIAELARDGFIARGLVPADAAAVIAFELAGLSGPTLEMSSGASRGPTARATIVEGCAVASGRGRPIAEVLDEAVASARSSGFDDESDRSARTRRPSIGPSFGVVDAIVIAPWGPPAEDALRSWIAMRFPAARIVSTAALGDSLAATPALAVIAAADLLDEHTRRVLVVTLGVDGDPGFVALSRGAA